MNQEAPTGEGGHQRRCHDLRNGEEVTKLNVVDKAGLQIALLMIRQLESRRYPDPRFARGSLKQIQPRDREFDVESFLYSYPARCFTEDRFFSITKLEPDLTIPSLPWLPIGYPAIPTPRWETFRVNQITVHECFYIWRTRTRRHIRSAKQLCA